MINRLFLVGWAALPLTAVYAGFVHIHPPINWNDWQLETAVDDVHRVSALALDADGSLYLTQENLNRDGRVLRLTPGQEPVTVIDQLDKPDGLFLHEGSLFVSQEGGSHPILEYTSLGEVKEWPIEASNLEQIWVTRIDGVRYLYGIEDHSHGRLLRYEFRTRTIEVLVDGIAQGEGVSLCPDGSLYYTEKALDRVNHLSADGELIARIEGFLEPGFVSCETAGFWVTEDHWNRASVWYVSHAPDYTRRLVASHLKGAQYLVRSSPNVVLVAEQGRNRVLRLSRAEAL